MQRAVYTVSLFLICVICGGLIQRGSAAETKIVTASTEPGKVNCLKCGKPFQMGLLRCPNPDCKARCAIRCPNSECGKPVTYGMIQCPNCEKTIPYSKIRIRLQVAPADPAGGGEKEPGPDTAQKPPPAPPKPKVDKKVLTPLIDKYVRTYMKHLTNSDWIVRSLAVEALSRVDDEKTTGLIIKTLKLDKSPLIKLCAWEALHSRVGSLNDQQYSDWVTHGIRLSARGGLPGNFRIPLIKAMAHFGPTAENTGFILHVIDSSAKSQNHHYSYGTLMAIRDVVKSWKDPNFTKVLIARLGAGSPFANTCEFVLGGYDSGIEAVGRLQPAPKARWAELRARWFKWLAQANLVPAKNGEIPKHAEAGRWFPEPDMVDPADPRWNSDIDTDNLRADMVDLVLCVDTNTRATPLSSWLQCCVGGLSAALELASKRSRIGITLFRHEIDPKAMDKCCQECIPGESYSIISTDKQGKTSKFIFKDYRTKKHPLTPNARLIVNWLKKEGSAPSHNEQEFSGNWDSKGNKLYKRTAVSAVYGGMVSAIREHSWGSGKKTKKILVVFAQSPCAKKTVPMAEKTAGNASAMGFVIHTVKVPTIHLLSQSTKPGFYEHVEKVYMPSMDQIAKAGKGKRFIYGLHGTCKTIGSEKAVKAQEYPGCADHSYVRIMEGIVQSAMPEESQKRLGTVLKLLLEWSYCNSVAPNAR